MIRKTLLIMVGVCLVALLAIGVDSSMKKRSEIQKVINEVNVLTDDAVRNVGDTPTVEGISRARKIVDERKNSIREKIKSLKDSGKLVKNSEAALELEFCAVSNINKTATVYDRFLAKSYEDLTKLNTLKERLIKLNSGASLGEVRNLRREILNQTRTIEENVNVLNGMDLLAASYKSIFEEQ